MTVKAYRLDLKTDPAVARELLRDGWVIAEDAAKSAPVDTGRGARSIRAEMAKDEHGNPEARVSWDQAAFYMAFAELGTNHQPARPFLRPAANRYQ